MFESTGGVGVVSCGEIGDSGFDCLSKVGGKCVKVRREERQSTKGSVSNIGGKCVKRGREVRQIAEANAQTTLASARIEVIGASNVCDESVKLW
jgi:hypothetical protein